MKKEGLVLAMPLMVILLSSLAIAGFGSSYLPDINGKPTFVVEPGATGNYFIYPQNMDNDSLYVKIVLDDKNNLVQNKLEESYTIPPNTLSDEFKIMLEIKVPSNAKIGSTYSIEYTLLSSVGKSQNETVTFSPVGYSKSFVVMNGQPIAKKYDKNLIWQIAICLIILIIIIIAIRKIARRNRHLRKTAVRK